MVKRSFVVIVLPLIAHAQAAVEYAMKSAGSGLSQSAADSRIGVCRVDSTLLSCLGQSYPRIVVAAGGGALHRSSVSFARWPAARNEAGRFLTAASGDGYEVITLVAPFGARPVETWPSAHMPFNSGVTFTPSL